MAFTTHMTDNEPVSKLVKYSIAGAVMYAVFDRLGAGLPVALMAGLIGPPLLYLGWLAAGKPGQ